jgi:hypothetical protein
VVRTLGLSTPAEGGTMKRRTLLEAAAGMMLAGTSRAGARQTTVSIQGDQFWINGRPTYPGRSYEGSRIEGLLMHSRMAQGIFSDSNPETIHHWRYPDTGVWDPERNTNEFVAAMPDWRRYGLLSFTVAVQAARPERYFSRTQPWRTSGIRPDGSLRPDYMRRLEKILDRADELGMVCVLNYFYFGQDEEFEGEDALHRAVQELTQWVLDRDYRNVLVELVNECDNKEYDQPPLRYDRVHELIRYTQSITKDGRRLLVSASFNGRSIPTGNVVEAEDFVLMHGNGVTDPAFITTMVEKARQLKEYRSMPVFFNEDDHFNFDKPANNMMNAIRKYASWGYHDPGVNNYMDGYQCPPVNWTINTERKKAFFETVKRVTGS